jgi:hypothetical protein
MTNLENWTGEVSDLTNEELLKLKKILFRKITYQYNKTIHETEINLDIILEIERELTLRRK